MSTILNVNFGIDSDLTIYEIIRKINNIVQFQIASESLYSHVVSAIFYTLYESNMTDIRVVCDKTNNTPATIHNHQFKVDLFFIRDSLQCNLHLLLGQNSEIRLNSEFKGFLENIVQNQQLLELIPQ